MLANPYATGRPYDLAGPRVYTWRELFGIALRLLGRRGLLLPVPFAVAGMLARLFGPLPSPPLTIGQVDLLKSDNVSGGHLPGLRDLDIQPTSVEEVLPT